MPEPSGRRGPTGPMVPFPDIDPRSWRVDGRMMLLALGEAARGFCARHGTQRSRTVARHGLVVVDVVGGGCVVDGALVAGGDG